VGDEHVRDFRLARAVRPELPGREARLVVPEPAGVELLDEPARRHAALVRTGQVELPQVDPAAGPVVGDLEEGVPAPVRRRRRGTDAEEEERQQQGGQRSTTHGTTFGCAGPHGRARAGA
jgi:hypothetical protein